MKRCHIPIIRCKGFYSNWVYRKLGECFDERNERSGDGELISVTINTGIRKSEELDRSVSISDLSNYKVVKAGDIAYNSMRMWQGASGYSPYNGILSPAYTVLIPHPDIDALFFSFLFKNLSVIHLFELNSQGLTSDTWNLKYPVFSSLLIKFPLDKSEQTAIARVLSTLDSLIKFREEAFAKLKVLKQSCLEKMFPKEGAKVPEIRFKGFDGDWEETTLADRLEVSLEKNADNKYDKYDIFSVSGEYGVVNQIEFQGKSFAGASLLGYKITSKGDIIYTKSPLKSQPYGIIKANKRCTGIVSTLYAVYKPDERTNADFIQRYFELDKRLNGYLRPLVNKGAKNTLLVSDEDAIKGVVYLPSLREQQAIADYFTSLDQLIAAREKELEKLRQIKKACLERMFVTD